MLSCKKNNNIGSNNYLISSAKTWFQKNQEGMTITVYGPTSSMPLRFNPKWESSQTEIIDGNNVLLVPVMTNLSKSQGSLVNFKLIVKENNGVYESKLIGVRPTGISNGVTMTLSDYFYTAFTSENIADTKIMNFDVILFNSKFQATGLVRYVQKSRQDLVFNIKNLRINTKNPDGSLKLPKENLFANMAPPTEGCQEQTWFWVLFTYDGEGRLLYYDVLWQLPSTWICEGGGGNDGALPIELRDFGTAVNEDMGGSAETDETIGIDHYKVKDLTWKFHSHSTFQGKSTEKGVVKITGSVRTWHSLTHKSYIKVGFWALGSFEFTNISFTPMFVEGSSGNATMEAKYTVKLVPLSYFGEYDSEYKYAYSSWDVNFNHQ